MTAIGAADEPAHWEILADILSRRRMSAFIQAFLNTLIRREANQPLMLTFAQRHIPIGMLEIAREQNLIEKLCRTFDSHCAVTACREMRF
ncbi:hypothetical protein [Roseovarius sp. 2305UL8-3]|uniref:hypothetical protein n=1 Tax=Roseovarius conchicola TaxID=3121636 RepID=UPI003527BE8C